MLTHTSHTHGSHTSVQYRYTRADLCEQYETGWVGTACRVRLIEHGAQRQGPGIRTYQRETWVWYLSIPLKNENKTTHYICHLYYKCIEALKYTSSCCSRSFWSMGAEGKVCCMHTPAVLELLTPPRLSRMCWGSSHARMSS